MKITHSIFLLFFAYVAGAQNPLVLKEFSPTHSINQHCYTYTDQTDTANIYQVMHANWEPPREGNLNFGVVRHPKWIKISILNSTQQPLKRFIYLPYHHIEYIDVFRVDSGKVINHVKTGTSRPYHNKLIPTPGYPIAFTFEPQKEVTVYARVDHRYLPLRASLFLLNEQQMFDSLSKSQGLIWFWKGVMFTAMVLSLVIFFFIRTRLFLYYAILLVGIIIFIGLEIGDFFQFFEIDPRNTIIDMKHFGNILVVFAFPMFINQLTPLQKLHPKLWKYTMYLIVPFIILFLAVLFNPVKNTLILYIITHYAIYVSAFIFFMQLVFLLSATLQKKKNALLLLMIYTFYVAIFWMTNSLPNLGLTQDNTVNVYGILLISSIMEVLTFMGLIARETFLIYRERTQLIQQQQQHQKRLLFATVESQEQERNKIGRELHDMVGANLAVIKQKVQKENEELRGIIHKTIESIRNLSHGLVTPQVTNEEFADEISELCILMTSGHRSVKCFFYNWEQYKANKETTTHLYRIVQELLQNAIKHSKASKVYLQFSMEYDTLTIAYDDNGIGLSTTKKQKKGLGMLNIENRVKLLNGKQVIQPTNQGSGTSILLSFKLN